MWKRMSCSGIATGCVALAVFIGLALSIAGPAGSETLSGENAQLHEGELVSSSVPSLHNGSGSLQVRRSIVGGLAPGHSAGASGLQLEGGVVAVPELGSSLQKMVVLLALVLLAKMRNGVRR